MRDIHPIYTGATDKAETNEKAATGVGDIANSLRWSQKKRPLLTSEHKVYY